MPTKPQTVFQVKIKIDAVDLRAKPFARDRASLDRPKRLFALPGLRPHGARGRRWRHPLRVRPRPEARRVLRGVVARRVRPADSLEQQTWMLSVARDRVIWQRTHVLDVEEHEFAAAQWSPSAH
jgi:hypothetical protein